MSERTTESIVQIASAYPIESIAQEFIDRAKEGLLTRDENPQTHFSTFFAGYDKESKKVFIGYHKKAGLWLFNGGHIDKGETPEETILREIGEEWGIKISPEKISEPKLLTISLIDNPVKQKCRKHFDIWFFISLSENEFKPDKHLLDKEFDITGWKSVNEAKRIVTDPATLESIFEFEKIFK